MRILVISIVLSIALLGQHARTEESVDPTRSWEGKPFADAVWDWLQRNSPETRLKILTEIDTGIVFRQPVPIIEFSDIAIEPRGFGTGELMRDAARDPYPKKIVQIVQNIVPKDVKKLSELLYAGQLIRQKGEASTENIEREVRAWLEAASDGVIAPHEIFGRAIVAAGGEILRAQIALWNIFSANWLVTSARNDNALARKLLDVTGERHLRDGAGQFIVGEETISLQGYRDNSAIQESRAQHAILNRAMSTRLKFVITKRGDTFGAFYHFIGVSLFTSYGSARMGTSSVGKALGWVGALSEAVLHQNTSGLPIERQKRISNDLNAATAGARLYEIAKNPERYPKRTEPMSAKDYLVAKSAYGGRYRLAEGVPPAYFGAKVDPKFWTKPMDVEELKMRFEYAIWVDPSIFHPLLLATSSDGERLHGGLGKYLADGALDPELNKMIADFGAGARGRSAHHTTYWNNPDHSDFSLSMEVAKKHFSTEYNGAVFDPLEGWKRILKIMNRIAIVQSGSPKSCKLIFAP